MRIRIIASSLADREFSTGDPKAMTALQSVRGAGQFTSLRRSSPLELLGSGSHRLSFLPVDAYEG